MRALGEHIYTYFITTTNIECGMLVLNIFQTYAVFMAFISKQYNNIVALACEPQSSYTYILHVPYVSINRILKIRERK